MASTQKRLEYLREVFHNDRLSNSEKVDQGIGVCVPFNKSHILPFFCDYADQLEYSDSITKSLDLRRALGFLSHQYVFLVISYAASRKDRIQKYPSRDIYVEPEVIRLTFERGLLTWNINLNLNSYSVWICNYYAGKRHFLYIKKQTPLTKYSDLQSFLQIRNEGLEACLKAKSTKKK